MKRPYPHVRCATAESPIVIELGEGLAARPLKDMEALRLFDELARALAVRLRRRFERREP